MNIAFREASIFELIFIRLSFYMQEENAKKKIKEGLELNFDFGSFEKLKSREIPHFFTIFILDKEKQNISKKIIRVTVMVTKIHYNENHNKNPREMEKQQQ